MCHHWIFIYGNTETISCRLYANQNWIRGLLPKHMLLVCCYKVGNYTYINVKFQRTCGLQKCTLPTFILVTGLSFETIFFFSLLESKWKLIPHNILFKLFVVMNINRKARGKNNRSEIQYVHSWKKELFSLDYKLLSHIYYMILISMNNRICQHTALESMAYTWYYLLWQLVNK